MPSESGDACLQNRFMDYLGPGVVCPICGDDLHTFYRKKTRELLRFCPVHGVAVKANFNKNHLVTEGGGAPGRGRAPPARPAGLKGTKEDK